MIGHLSLDATTCACPTVEPAADGTYLLVFACDARLLPVASARVRVRQDQLAVLVRLAKEGTR